MLPIVEDSISAVEKFIEISKIILDSVPNLHDEQFKCEQAIRDIEHFIENNNKISRTKSAQLVREMKKYRNLRREIIDTIDVLSPIASFFGARESYIKECNNRLNESIKIYQDKHIKGAKFYKARVLYELFGQEPPQTAISMAMNKAGVE